MNSTSRPRPRPVRLSAPRSSESQPVSRWMRLRRRQRPTVGVTLPRHDDDLHATNTDTGLDVVTGAFSYSGRAIAAELRKRGRRVRTMTGHPERGGGDETTEVRPLDFGDLPGMVASLSGATTLYNTYWV